MSTLTVIADGLRRKGCLQACTAGQARIGAAVTSVHQLLNDRFGFSHFRGVQEAVVDRAMAGEHTLAVMPTGAGKSLCYQLPALARHGTAIVISPLIALMQDQVRSAEALGVTPPR